MRASFVALAIMGAAASLPSSGSGAVSRLAAYSIRSLGYPWADATTLRASSFDWGYSTCRKDIGANCSAITSVWGGRRYYQSDPWKYYLRNCTSYVAWRLHSLDVPTNVVVGLGYAAQWPGNAKAKGIAVGSTPQVGAAAVDPSAAPPYGHVGFVTAVNRDGTITVDEYNFFSHGNGDEWTGKPSEHGFTTYVYFGRYEKTSAASHNPFGSFDTLTTSDGRATATGWAADPDSPKAAIKVQLQVDGKVKATVAANGARADVARHYPSYGAAHGFSTGLTLSPGRHTVCAEALNTGTGTNTSLGCKTVTVKAAPQPTTTTSASSVHAAQDGMIVFVSDRDGSDAIWGIPAGGGSPRELTHPDSDNGESDSTPSFSPDGNEMIFVRQASDGSSNLWIANADGSNAHQLVSNVVAASFSPDGKQLAVIVPSANGNNALALVPSSGGAANVICDQNDGLLDAPAFSPDGESIAYSDGDRGIVIATLGSTPNCASALLGVIGADDPSYGPDGTIAWDEPNSDDSGFDIWTKHPGQPAQRIIADGSNNVNPVISPAGDKIVFSSDNTDTGTQVFIANLDGSNIVSIGDPQAACVSGYCQGDSNPGWQPIH